MPSQDVYTRITDSLVTLLEAGTRPWIRPWNATGAASYGLPLRATGEPYRGVNVLMLWAAAQSKGFSSPYWFTYKQAQEMKGNVKRGEQGSFVCFASRVTRTETNENGEETERDIPFMKGYTVFNADQCENMPAKFSVTLSAVPAAPSKTRLTNADSFFAATGANIKFGGNRAFYSPLHDFVQVPNFEDFSSANRYAATMAHELVHWTGHENRLARGEKFNRFGSEAYAAEELVAEIGSAFICAHLGCVSEIMDDHASYIASWLKVLKNDKRFIFTAASAAQKAADFLNAFQTEMKVAA